MTAARAIVVARAAVRGGPALHSPGERLLHGRQEERAPARAARRVGTIGRGRAPSDGPCVPRNPNREAIEQLASSSPEAQARTASKSAGACCTNS